MRTPLLVAALTFLTQAARAQVALPDTTSQKPASEGNTDIENEELAGAHREKTIYENRPLPGKVQMDTMTSASLVYSVH